MITNLFIYYRDGQSPARGPAARGLTEETAATDESAPAEGAAVTG